MDHLNSDNGKGSSPPDRPGEVAWLPAVEDTWDGDAVPARGAATRRPISLHAVLRHKWFAVGVFLLLALPGATLAWVFTKPVYKGQATVEVSPMIPRIVYDTEQSGIIPLYEQYLNDQVLVLRSPTVLERVLDDGQVQRTNWYKHQPQPLFDSPTSKLERLRDEMKAAVRPRTSFVDVHLIGPDPTEVALIVNTVVDEYLKFVNEKAQRFDDDVYKVLSEEYNSLQATIDGLKSVISELRSDLLTANPEDLQTQQRQRLDTQVAALEEARRATTLAEWQGEQLKGLLSTAADAQDESVPYALDAEWRRYFMELKSAEHEAALRSASLGENNDIMIELNQRVSLAQDRLQIRQEQLADILAANPSALLDHEAGGLSLKRQLTTHERMLEQLKFEEQQQSDAVERERDRLEKTASAADMLAKELDKLRYAEQRFEDVRQRKVAMEIERRAPASIRIQDRAFPPSQASNAKRRWALLALAITGALTAAAGLTLVRVIRNPAVEMPEELSATTAPFLGRVPWIEREPISLHEAAAQAECARMVRTSLLQRLGEGPPHALQVTSANTGAGKTSALVLLGESLGRCGKRVLLVDADTRRPALHGRIGIDISPGLTDVLQERIDEKSAIRKWAGNPHVEVLPAGDATECDEELLSGPVLDHCLAEWRRRYDVILFDGPPLLPIADARILARRLDGNLLVIREGHCRRHEVSEAMLGLCGAGGKLMGIVFFSRRRSGGYYGDGYGYAYGQSNGNGNGKSHAPSSAEPQVLEVREGRDEVYRGTD